MDKTVAVDLSSLTYIQNVVQTAKLVGIENVIVETDRVRGVSEDRSVVILQTKDVPTMPFGTIVLNQIDVFTSRLEIAKGAGNFEVVSTIDTVVNKETKATETFSRSLAFKGKGVKLDYRCGNPLLVKAPKALNDPMLFDFKISPEAVLMISKGQSAMSSDEALFVGDKKGVMFEMRDINGDVMSYSVADEMKCHDKTVVEFKHTYPVKILLPLFKVVPNAEINVSTRGIMQVQVNNLNVFIMPRV